MRVTKISLRNWRNFRQVKDIEIGERAFVVGPNAAGKSNLLDCFRFLRDIAKPGGGLQKAVADRDGLSHIRCLAARQRPDVEIDVELSEAHSSGANWRYAIGIKQQPRGDRKPFLAFEKVWKNGSLILDRPDKEDESDAPRLTQTHLEQISANVRFRDVAKFFENILYLHLVPQLVRHPREFSGPGISGDPFGRSFLERMAQTPDRIRKSRLQVIEKAMVSAVPQLKHLTHIIDTGEGGIPHLEAVYTHWRPHGARQRERDFSDGTLRLIGLLWSLLEGDSLLLLEEPELSLNSAIVRRLPSIIHRMQRRRNRQIIISTHSADLLSEAGIGGEEVLLLTPSAEGTDIQVASKVIEVKALLESGLTVAEAALPRTAPPHVEQLELFDAVSDSR